MRWLLTAAVLAAMGALFTGGACAADPPVCEFSLTGLPPVFYTDQAQREIRVMFDHPTGEDFDQPKCRYTITDFGGKAVESGTLSLGQSLVWGSALAIVKPKVKQPGWYKINLELTDKAGNYHLKNRTLPHAQADFATFAVVPPVGPGPRPDSYFGVCEHELNPNLAFAMKRAGVRWMRTDAFWGDVQPDRETWSWGRLDGISSLAAEYGISLLPIINYGNAWSNGLADGERKLPAKTDWVRFVTELVKRYKKRLKVWEVWNEPNIPNFWLGTQDEYGQLLQWTYNAVKAADPKASVLLGGTSGTDLEWIRGVLAGGGHRFTDESAIHPYMQPNAPERGLAPAIESERALEARITSPKPLWLTEMGYHTSGGGAAIDGPTQAKYAVRAMLTAAGAGVKRFIWYEFSDPRNDPGDSESNFGLVYHDMEPKPSYVAYAVLERVMWVGAKVAKVPYGDRRYRLYSITGTGSDGKPAPPVLVAWTVDGKGEVRLTAKQVEAMDIMGVRTKLSGAGGTVAVPVGEAPTYLAGVEAKALVVPAQSPQQSPQASMTGTNLVPNGDFEERTASGKTPARWTWRVNGKPKVTYKHVQAEVPGADAHSGRSYLNMTYGSPREGHVYGYLATDVAVKPYTRYRLTARVRTAGLKCAWIGGGPGWGVRFYFPGDTQGEWAEVEGVLETWQETTWNLMVLIEDFAERCDVDSIEMVELAD